MKKKLITVLALILVTFSAGVLVACGNKIVEKTYIKSGTIATTVVMGSTVDTSNAVFVIQYKNSSKKEIAADQLTFSQINTQTIGVKTMTVTYKSLTATIEIEVVESQTTVVTAYQLESKLLNSFDENKKQQTGTGLKKNEFYDREQPLYVGTENLFDFSISATGVDQNENLAQNINRIRSVISVEIKEGQSYTLLEGEELEEMVEIDTTYVTLQFTPQAAGNVFKVSVRADQTEDGYDTTGTSFTAELTVIEGYNVYNAKQLSVYNNSNKDIDWAPTKQLFGLEDVETNTIILQNDINITKDDVPAEFFWKQGDTNYSAAQALTTETLEGTLKDIDSRGVYTRNVGNGESFSMIGNYFKIDVTNFPKVVVEMDGENPTVGVNVEADEIVTSHATLFYTTSSNHAEITEGTETMWKNIRFIGNAPLNNDVLNSGGIIQSKHNAVSFTGYNTVTTNFYATYFLEVGEKENFNSGNFLLDKVKGYDSFSTLVYIWGARNAVIRDSEFVSAGGPAIIADHAFSDDSDITKGYPSHVDIINSKIESVVNGQEPWFKSYNATQIVQALTQLDVLFTAFESHLSNDKTIIAKKENAGDENELLFLNLIIAMKGGGVDLNPHRINGRVNIFQSMQDYNKHYGLNGETQEQTTHGLDLYGDTSPLSNKAFGASLPYIQSNGNGGYTRGDGADNSIAMGKPFDVGTHLNIYTQLGIGAIVQLYDRPAD